MMKKYMIGLSLPLLAVLLVLGFNNETRAASPESVTVEVYEEGQGFVEQTDLVFSEAEKGGTMENITLRVTAKDAEGNPVVEQPVMVGELSRLTDGNGQAVLEDVVLNDQLKMLGVWESHQQPLVIVPEGKTLIHKTFSGFPRSIYGFETTYELDQEGNVITMRKLDRGSRRWEIVDSAASRMDVTVEAGGERYLMRRSLDLMGKLEVAVTFTYSEDAFTAVVIGENMGESTTDYPMIHQLQIQDPQGLEEPFRVADLGFSTDFSTLELNVENNLVNGSYVLISGKYGKNFAYVHPSPMETGVKNAITIPALAEMSGALTLGRNAALPDGTDIGWSFVNMNVSTSDQEIGGVTVPAPIGEASLVFPADGTLAYQPTEVLYTVRPIEGGVYQWTFTKAWPEASTAIQLGGEVSELVTDRSAYKTGETVEFQYRTGEGSVLLNINDVEMKENLDIPVSLMGPREETIETDTSWTIPSEVSTGTYQTVTSATYDAPLHGYPFSETFQEASFAVVEPLNFEVDVSPSRSKVALLFSRPVEGEDLNKITVGDTEVTDISGTEDPSVVILHLASPLVQEESVDVSLETGAVTDHYGVPNEPITKTFEVPRRPYPFAATSNADGTRVDVTFTESLDTSVELSLAPFELLNTTASIQTVRYDLSDPQRQTLRFNLSEPLEGEEVQLALGENAVRSESGETLLGEVRQDVIGPQQVQEVVDGIDQNADGLDVADVTQAVRTLEDINGNGIWERHEVLFLLKQVDGYYDE